MTLDFLSQLKFYSQSPSSRYEANTDGSIVCKREFSHQSCQEGTPGDPGSPPSALGRSQTITRKLSLERPKLGRQVSPRVCGMHVCVCVCVCVYILLPWDVHVSMCMSAGLLKPKEIKAIFHCWETHSLNPPVYITQVCYELHCILPLGSLCTP